MVKIFVVGFSSKGKEDRSGNYWIDISNINSCITKVYGLLGRNK